MHPNRPALGRAAQRFRMLHLAIAVLELASLAYVWICAVTRRRGPVLRGAVAALSVEGVALVVGGGNCPFGPLQRRLGDSTPLFELVLSPRAAKAAVPVLAGTTIVGILLVALRPPTG